MYRTTEAAKTFENVTFNSKTAFFSTDGSMTAPVDSVTAKTMAGKIDITFFYNYDYSEPGFIDPVTRPGAKSPSPTKRKSPG